MFAVGGRRSYLWNHLFIETRQTAKIEVEKKGPHVRRIPEQPGKEIACPQDAQPTEGREAVKEKEQAELQQAL